jgi:hypothetical protein
MGKRRPGLDPAGPRPVWVGGFLLGFALLVAAYFTFPNIHNLWEIPVGGWLFLLSMGKMAAR